VFVRFSISFSFSINYMEKTRCRSHTHAAAKRPASKPFKINNTKRLKLTIKISELVFPAIAKRKTRQAADM